MGQMATQALTGLGRHAHAYWYNARAAYVDDTSADARKGCAETLGALAKHGPSPAVWITRYGRLRKDPERGTPPALGVARSSQHKSRHDPRV